MGWWSKAKKGVSNFAGNLTGGLIGESDAEKASKDAMKASRSYEQANVGQFFRDFLQTEEDFKPYIESGAQAISDLMDMKFGDPDAPELAMFAYPNPQKPELDVFKYATPKNPQLQEFVFDATQLGGTDAYKWRYGEGLKATERALAANRGLRSGSRLTALQQYGQGAASQEYENEWSRQLRSNLAENERRLQGFGADVARFGLERQKSQDEQTRRMTEYGADVGRFERAMDVSKLRNLTATTQYGLESDRYRNIIDRLTGQATQGERAATNLASQRAYKTGGITGARGQSAANQFAASLIPVQEKQQFISGAMDLAGTMLGGGLK